MNEELDINLIDRFIAGDITPQEARRVLGMMRDDPVTMLKVETLLELEGRESASRMPMLSMAADDELFRICAAVCEDRIRRMLDGDDGVPRNIDEESSTIAGPGGVRLYRIGRRLQEDGRSVARQYGASMDDIAKRVFSGCGVIAVADRGLLAGRPASGTLHAVQVTAVKDDAVTIFDPADGAEKDVPHQRFLDAWDGAMRYCVTAARRGGMPYSPRPADIDADSVDGDILDAAGALAEEAHEAREAACPGDRVPYGDLPEARRRAEETALLHTLRVIQRMGYDIRKHRNDSFDGSGSRNGEENE